MPNWCQNKLHIIGDEAQLLAFAKANAGILKGVEAVGTTNGPDGLMVLTQNANERLEQTGSLSELMQELDDHPQPLSCERLLPTPPKALESEAWYDWRVTHWGTKWDLSFSGPGVALICSDDFNEDVFKGGVSLMPAIEGSSLLYKFDTAWAPPVPWFMLLARKWPELEFVLQFAECGEGYAGRIRQCRAKQISTEEVLDIDDVVSEEERYF